MLSENLDDKIKDSLADQSTAYNEASWLKMKTLLDKQLPEKKNDRRRLLIFLFLFLVAGGGLTILFNGIISQNKTASTISPVAKNENAEIKNSATPVNEASKINKENSNIHSETVESNSQKDISTKATESLPTDKKIISEVLPGNKPTSSISKKNNKNISDKRQVLTEKKYSPEKNNPLVDNFNKSSAIIKSDLPAETIIQNNQAEKKPTEDKITEPVVNPDEKKKITDTEKEKTTEIIPPVSKNEKTVKQKSFLKNILFSVSAGLDKSSVGNTNTGKIKTSLGAGIGYKISNRFTIRSGVYMGSKVYVAAPKDYNPPANFWNYYPNLKTIDADCKILEVPILVDYNFGMKNKHSWFASAGLSSLFMKKEEYEYYFKPPYTTQYIYYSRTIENQNKHYLSVLDLSVGYTRKINSHLTLQAEPYYKIALKGVGYGKVKLNSGGVLFSAVLQPFHQQGIKKK